MSHERIPRLVGFELECGGRAPKGCCRWCGGPVPSSRHTFCGPACVHEFKLRRHPTYQAKHVLKRDRGICELCGRDCVATLADLRAIRSRAREARWNGQSLPCDDRLPEFKGACDALALPPHLRGLCRRLWEMDHRIPVSEGGGACGLENLRTLCWACHHRQTTELVRRRREAIKARIRSANQSG